MRSHIAQNGNTVGRMNPGADRSNVGYLAGCLFRYSLEPTTSILNGDVVEVVQ